MWVAEIWHWILVNMYLLSSSQKKKHGGGLVFVFGKHNPTLALCLVKTRRKKLFLPGKIWETWTNCKILRVPKPVSIKLNTTSVGIIIETIFRSVKLGKVCQLKLEFLVFFIKLLKATTYIECRLSSLIYCVNWDFATLSTPTKRLFVFFSRNKYLAGPGSCYFNNHIQKYFYRSSINIL